MFIIKNNLKTGIKICALRIPTSYIYYLYPFFLRQNFISRLYKNYLVCLCHIVILQHKHPSKLFAIRHVIINAIKTIYYYLNSVNKSRFETMFFWEIK